MVLTERPIHLPTEKPDHTSKPGLSPREQRVEDASLPVIETYDGTSVDGKPIKYTRIRRSSEAYLRDYYGENVWTSLRRYFAQLSSEDKS